VDADCTGGKWCDESVSTCTSPLANGAAMPTDAPHTNPALDGRCSASAGALVCASGVCDGVDNECGYANGDGPCNATNAPTVCRSGACSSDGTCEPVSGCNVDADCPAGNWCNVTAHTCTPKLANGAPIPSDPAHRSPALAGACTDAVGQLVCVAAACDVKNNECGYANGDGPCTTATGPSVCQSGACSADGTCEPNGGCNVDADCTNPATPACAPASHTCQAATDAGAPDDAGPAAAVPDRGYVEGGGGCSVAREPARRASPLELFAVVALAVGVGARRRPRTRQR
jgi:hypothetical protein